MRYSTSNCVALGVPNVEQALDVYVGKLGFEMGKRTDTWTELNSGALTLYIVQDDVHQPCFDIEVDDVGAAQVELSAAGFEKVELAPNELFMRDPFGYLFCISPRKLG